MSHGKIRDVRIWDRRSLQMKHQGSSFEGSYLHQFYLDEVASHRIPLFISCCCQ